MPKNGAYTMHIAAINHNDREKPKVSTRNPLIAGPERDKICINIAISDVVSKFLKINYLYSKIDITMCLQLQTPCRRRQCDECRLNALNMVLLNFLSLPETNLVRR